MVSLIWASCLSQKTESDVDIFCSYSGLNLIRISNINNKNKLHVPAFSALLQDLSQLSSLLSAQLTVIGFEATSS